MTAAFLYAFRGLRVALVGWGFGLVVLALAVMYLYTSFITDQAEEIQELVDGLPKAFTDFAKLDDVTSPKTFLDIRYFSLVVIFLGIYAALTGAAALSRDEELGRLDLILAHPLTRREVFLGRWFALVVVLVGIHAIGWSGMAAGTLVISMRIDPVALIPAFASLLATVLVFANLGLVFSMVLPSRRAAGVASVLVLVISFFLSGFSRVDPSFEPLAGLLPLQYYQGAAAIEQFNASWFVGLIVASLACAAIAYWRFERRDIRVSGEGVMPWRGVGAIAALVIVALAVPVVMSLQPVRYDTPQEAFEAAAGALESEDWPALARSLTPEGMDEWNAVLLTYGAATRLRAEALTPGASGMLPETSPEELITLFSMMGKFRAAMRYVDADRLKGSESTVRAFLFRTILSGGVPEVGDAERSLAELVTDREKFFTKAMRAWETAHHYPNVPSLTGVHVEGETATGMLSWPDGTKRPVTFRRSDGSWRIGLSFMPGERRVLE